MLAFWSTGYQTLTGSKSKILVLNGPNLNLLGQREPGVYGNQGLPTVLSRLEDVATEAGVGFDHLQTNAEHELIDRIHQAKSDGTSFIVINPAAWTHTSVALRDALAAVALPFIEIHISNIHRREPFRHHSYLSDLATGVICGLGTIGYEMAMVAAIRHLEQA